MIAILPGQRALSAKKVSYGFFLAMGNYSLRKILAIACQDIINCIIEVMNLILR
ncbi:MAG: hypothetical protein AAFN00_20770 [Cyanobacteria bacterium J06558_2]